MSEGDGKESLIHRVDILIVRIVGYTLLSGYESVLHDGYDNRRYHHLVYVITE